MSDDAVITDNALSGRLSFHGKILFKLLNDDQFYRDVVKSNRLSISNFPKYDQWTNPDGFFIEFALAGYSKDDVFVGYEGNVIYVSSNHDDSQKNNSFQQGMSKGVISRGIARRSFKTSFYISPSFDTSRCKSSMKEGLLTVFVPLATDVGPKEIIVE